MIRTYCQYSYGGFKTLYIRGIEDELLDYDAEVTLTQSHGFPEDAHVFFQYGGCKIIYKQLNNGEYALVVREIPGNNTDGAGRPINCAVQFIGEQADRKTLDNMALVIANDIVGFSKFFADLFYAKRGLRVNGDKLNDFVKKYESPIKISGDTNSILRTIPKRNEVMLFVPLSAKFGTDVDVTRRVCSELHLSPKDLANSVISLSQLMSSQNKLSIVSETSDYPATTEDEAKINNSDEVTSNICNTSLEQITQENISLKQKLQDAQSDIQRLSSLQEECRQKVIESENLKNTLALYRKIIFWLAIIILILLITTCSHLSMKRKNHNIISSTYATEAYQSKIFGVRTSV